MTGLYGSDALEDARHPGDIRIDSLALRYVPLIGPAAWTVYSYLIFRASQPVAAWPGDHEIAVACGISVYNARKAVETLLEHRLIGRHVWKGHPAGRATYTILPVAPPSIDEQTVPEPEAGESSQSPADTAPFVEFDGPITFEDETEAPSVELSTPWRQERQERRTAREIFDAFIDALRLNPLGLSDDERASLGLASRIVSEAGGQPEEVPVAAARFARLWPDRMLDPLDIANNWNLLVPESGSPPSTGVSGNPGPTAGAGG